MTKFTLKCNKCNSENIDISVISYHNHEYEIMLTCESCGNKEEQKEG